MSASSEEIEGWDAFKDGLEKSDNPYPPESKQYDDWNFGWDRAWRHYNGEDY